ncbi:hypothetical protein MLD38_011271 [Melastoma candidum]|uniref:Uncharacterized protein n=1 Tax=Melastoma candidum TaxID=119954 RepID=A0ACB9R2M0_9MYRT|nr:hypothetical protein MLD38_011271 [Melastoma candidum]
MTAPEANGRNPYDSSPGGGGGAGGKFRKKPYRRPHSSTPYDRPPSSVRDLSGLLPSFAGGERSGNGGWLRRIVNPAQRIISASAHKLFGSVFQKRITRPPPPATPTPPSHEFVQGGQENQQEAVNRSSREHQAAVHDVQKATPANDDGSFVTLETVLKQRTFSQSEIDRLTALLHAKALDSSVANEVEKPEVFPSGFHDLEDGCSIIVQKADGNENNLPIPHAIRNDDVASPLKLAKSYMGPGLSKIAPSGFREDSMLITSSQQTPRLPIMSLVPTSSNQRVVHDNVYTTPRSRGRSAIYSMARTPCARVHQNTSLQILASMCKRGNVRSVAPQESELERIPGSSALKRRSSVFENDIGSVGPVRRIRHKPNLLYKNNNSLLSSTSAASCPVSLPSTESNNKFSDQSGSNECIIVPSKNMSSSKSTEIASKISEQLDKIVSPPKEKSFVVRLASLRDKASLKLSPSDLHGKALKSLEHIDSSKFLDITSGGSKLDNSVSTSHQDSGASALQDINKVEQGALPPASNRPEETIVNGCTMLNHKVVDFEEINHLTMPSAPKKQTFKIREDYYDLDDGDQQNVAVPTKLVEEAQKLDSIKMKSLLGAEADREDGFAPVSHLLKNGKTWRSPFTADSSEKTVTFSFPGMPSAKKNLKPNQPVSETSNSEKEPSVASSVFSFDMKASSANVEKTVTPVFAFASNGPVTKDAEKSTANFASQSLLSESSSRSFSTISVGPVTSVTKATELNKVNEKKDPSPGILETSGAPPSVMVPPTTGLFKFGVPSGPAAASQPSLSSAAESNAPPLERPLGNLPLVASSTAQGTNGKSSLLQSSSTFAVQAPIFKFGSTTSPETTAVAPVETQTKVVSGSEKAAENPFSASSASPMGSTFGFSSPASNGAPSNKVGAASFGVSNGFSQVQASTSSLGLSSSTQTFPQLGSSAPSFSFGLTGNTNASSGSFLFSSPAAVKFSSWISSGETVLPSLESTVASSSSSTTTGLFGSLQTTAAPAFATPASLSPSPSSGFSFGAMSSSAGSISLGQNVSSMSSSKSILGSSGASTSSNGPSNFTSNGSSPASSVVPIFGAAASTSTASPTVTFGASTVSSPSQPVHGNSRPVFPFGQTSNGKNSDQMNAEDMMAEDTMPAAAPSASLFGQQPISPAPTLSGSLFGQQPVSPAPTPSGSLFGQQPVSPAPMPSGSLFGQQPVLPAPAASGSFFGQLPVSPAPMPSGSLFGQQPVSPAPAPAGSLFGQQSVSSAPLPSSNFVFGSGASSSFQFGGQPSFAPPTNPSPFAASGSLGLNSSGGGSFSLGTGGGDKSGRKIIRVKRRK